MQLLCLQLSICDDALHIAISVELCCRKQRVTVTILNASSSEAENCCSIDMTQKSDFTSLIKFNGVPILPPVVCETAFSYLLLDFVTKADKTASSAFSTIPCTWSDWFDIH